MEDGRFPSQGLWNLSHKNQFLTPTLTHTKHRGEGPKIYIFLNIMLNLKNNKNDAHIR